MYASWSEATHESAQHSIPRTASRCSHRSRARRRGGRLLPTAVDAAAASGLRTAVDCVTDPAAAGELAFSAGQLTVAEGAGERAVLVLRRNGSTGPLNATITAVDGLATSGSDYGSFPSSRPLRRRRRHRRGDPRADRAGHRGRAARDAAADDDRPRLRHPRRVTTVEITILDDDLATTFSVGGTVTGLEGTGLVLRNNFIDEVTPVDGRSPSSAGCCRERATSVEIASQPSTRYRSAVSSTA